MEEQRCTSASALAFRKPECLKPCGFTIFKHPCVFPAISTFSLRLTDEKNTQYRGAVCPLVKFSLYYSLSKVWQLAPFSNPFPVLGLFFNFLHDCAVLNPWSSVFHSACIAFLTSVPRMFFPLSLLGLIEHVFFNYWWCYIYCSNAGWEL